MLRFVRDNRWNALYTLISIRVVGISMYFLLVLLNGTLLYGD